MLVVGGELYILPFYYLNSSLHARIGIFIILNLSVDFPGGSDGKESAHNAGDLGLIPGLGRCPSGEHGNPLQYSCMENPHGQKNLAG